MHDWARQAKYPPLWLWLKVTQFLSWVSSYDKEIIDFSPCEENEGDCDNDSHCNGDLKCGKDNCPANFHASADCCYKPETSK